VNCSLLGGAILGRYLPVGHIAPLDGLDMEILGFLTILVGGVLGQQVVDKRGGRLSSVWSRVRWVVKYSVLQSVDDRSDARSDPVTPRCVPPCTQPMDWIPETPRDDASPT
jgi:hypothetical protein